ncbi:hypothetical protein [Psychroserpens luteolus]|uniref:hypothetical protein n=1 Tax=Psychroserpens luteolus TaxID=2855840 RepID=UPI001E65C8B1|nr:hypothetical protein [Psychroserpens luteolus]MCD2259121.1 hypothetical protein [Psychroserpens luteolus]
MLVLCVLGHERSELALARSYGSSSGSFSFANFNLTNATHERSELAKQTIHKTVVLNLKNMFWKAKNKLKPKEDFYSKIENYYLDKALGKIPKDLLNDLFSLITRDQYNSYGIKWHDYPKSRKRYSEFKISDLEHPYTQNDIIVFFKKRDKVNYKLYSSLLLNMSEQEIVEFEIRREEFESYF